VFKSIAREFDLSGDWLIGEDVSTTCPSTLTDPPQSVPSQALFSEVYDQYLAEVYRRRRMESEESSQRILSAFERFAKILNDPEVAKKLETETLKEFVQTAEKAAEVIRGERKKRESVIPFWASSQKLELTIPSTCERSEHVKSPLKNLLQRLAPATQEPGKKSELAEFLGAPLASVSRWLSGDREPGGEVALKMLQWVERQERK